MQFLKNISVLLLAVLAGLPLFAQEKQEEQDSLVVLISAQSAQMVDIEGAAYRKVIGPARFLHNNTYLLCDTALWNVETRIIDAWGDVSILQEETVLTSEKLTYLIDNDLAQFRGTLVQLVDKDHNTLRTRHLDYNTKDSVAVFMNGGAMRDKDGQIIESRNGTYDSKVKLFTFENDVNMFTDSIFVRTRDLKYESDLNLATFGRATNAWKDDNMLSSESGWYDRGRELFFFTDNVHIMSEDQEGWCDSLYFDRVTTGIEMLGNAQVSDTTRNVYGLAGRLEYVDSLAKVTMTRKPAVISQTENPDGSIDTDIVHLEEGMVVVKATVRIDGVIVSTGLAYEREGSSYINKTSFIENCETSSVGRALGFLGIGAQEGIPTKEEMENAIEQQERLETKIKKTEAKAIASRIYDLDEAGKLNTDKIRDAYGIKDFADLNYEQYDDLLRKLKRIEDAK